MNQVSNRKRWIFIIIFFFFLIFHQLDLALLRNLTPEIMGSFFIDKTQTSVLITVSLVIELVFYLIWGYLFDKQPRIMFLSWGSAIWWMTSWMMGLSPTYETFMISYYLGSVDDAINSGIYSFVGDFFGPKNRGKVIGIFISIFPFTLLLSAIIIPRLMLMFEWRVLFFIFGGIGLLFAFLIVSFIKCPKRGEKEPALANIDMKGVYLFEWSLVKDYFKQKSVLFLIGAGFFGMIPWFVLTSRLSIYIDSMNTEESVSLFMSAFPTLLALTLGNPLSGLIGDVVFRSKKNGRILVSFAGTILTLLFLIIAFMNLDITSWYFILMIILMGLFMAFSLPNLLASLMDVTLPEMRSFIFAIFLIFLTVSQFITPYLLEVLQRYTDLRSAILWLCLGSGGISLLFHTGLFVKIPNDIERLRRHMAHRSQLETQLAAQAKKD